ncbi:MAG TPA: hypothetical protein VGH99_06970 [Pseudonocardia sp.]|jgi:hypothetical protein
MSISDLEPSTRDFQRQAITDHLLTALEDVVWRYRATRPFDGADTIKAEALTAEVAHQLEVARSSLRRFPPVRAVG